MQRRKFLKASVFGTSMVVSELGSAAESASLRANVSTASATHPAQPGGLEFSRMLVHWTQYVDPGYLSFVDEIQPEVARVGFYGVYFWAFGHVPKAVRGSTAGEIPGDGNLKAAGLFLENLNKELHRRGIKVVGHFDVEYHVTGLIDGPQGPREGFFQFYNQHWDEKELGPKPVKDPLDLLQRNPDGSPISIRLSGFSPWPIFHGCMNNPHWRSVLKAFVKRGIERGVDGYIANYFYLNGCMCQHCVRGFKDHLRRRYQPLELLKQFGIEDLEKHQFSEIAGSYDPDKMTPLRLEGLRFTCFSMKRAYDEVFIAYGRSLKPNLVVAQWLHSYQPTPSNDERYMLPPELWGKGEDYLWYCVRKSEPTLQLRYMRGAGGDRPFNICHYESVKIRASMAESAANGGSPMARYANFNDPDSRQELVRFFQFMRQHDDVYRASTMAGECVLLHPRSQLQQGRFTDATSAYSTFGFNLLDNHILFDVLPDDIATPDKLARYRRVFTISSIASIKTETFAGLSRFDAPNTVRVSASQPEKGHVWDIHFVNYSRQDPGEKKTGFAADENPIPVSGVKADLASPPGFSINKIEWMTPESPEPRELQIARAGNRVRFTAPEFVVYGVARAHLGPGLSSSKSDAAADSSSFAAAQPLRSTGTAHADNAGHVSADAECCDPTCPLPQGSSAAGAKTPTTDNYIEDIRAARRSSYNRP